MLLKGVLIADYSIVLCRVPTLLRIRMALVDCSLPAEALKWRQRDIPVPKKKL